MAKYKGKNDNKTVRQQVASRGKYAAEAFKDLNGERHVSVTDFNFSERVYYGRIDVTDDVVVPLPSAMVPLGSDVLVGELKLVLPFVRDMYAHFRGKFDQAALLGDIPDSDPFLSDITAHKTFEDPLGLYENHITDFIDTYNQQYLAIPKYGNQVVDFHTYVKHFIRFFKILGKNHPVTLTAFQKSNKSNVFTNGISISISNLDCSDDALKEEFFLDKKCLNFYLNVAKQYGFSVTKNAPWILVADLNSPSTLLYLKKYGLSNPQQIFDTYYIKTYTIDLHLLPKILQKGYNNFINGNEFIKLFETCKKNTNAKRIYRKKLNNNILKNKYNNQYWIPLYIKIRNIEQNMPYNEPEQERMIKKALSFEKLLDMDRAMRYINEQYRARHKEAEGGIVYYVKRTNARQRSEEK